METDNSPDSEHSLTWFIGKWQDNGGQINEMDKSRELRIQETNLVFRDQNV